ncbi:ABC transporter, permease protein [Fructilactobacillus florum 8D]|uniref:Transport permease protein n=1 Tax=Fructilactobacillus florum 8D TaxID=1221538 RepID=W9EHH1_9LACO|nr:ABC transporter permease [Fructilactobacillus florum]EKK21121.1 ABC transporter, permease protein [Fructilactobacillus florum 2F]ETO40711.1 ABC transporter, permease protein [Fructilactobacillus florum 8D]
MQNLRKHLWRLLANTRTLAYRNLLKTWHNPDQLLDVVVQPVLFMLMFSYLFGGAIAGSVHNYLPTLVPGILMQALLAAATGSGSLINEDLQQGVFQRIKALPISRLAPLLGQLVADSLRLLLAATAAIVTGYLIGWRPAAGFQWVIIVVGLDIFLGWTLSWIFVLYGLLAKRATMVESMSLMTMLILIFLSNAFVPVHTLPPLVRFLVKINPVSYVITASRTMLNHGYWSTSAWIVLLAGIVVLLLFIPLTVFVYNRKD